MMKYIKALMIFILASCIVYFSCSPKTVKNNECRKSSTAKTNGPDREFMKEGFINSGTYRIIIVSTKSECLEGLTSIEKKAKKRAVTSLKKYIQSTGKRYTQSLNTGMINLINDNGHFSRKDESCNKDLIFFFDIKKDNIKYYINTISSRE